MRVLEDWCPPFAGFFLYYPSRRQQPVALSALIETLRLELLKAHNAGQSPSGRALVSRHF